MEPLFLELHEVLEIQRNQIELYGGSLGIRDMGLLQSALGTPRATFGGSYLHGDVPEMAAAYLFHIVRNHPFVDGNKRAGAMAAFVFLRLNGWTLAGTAEPAFEVVVLGIADGSLPKEAATTFFRRHARAPHTKR